MRNFSNDLKELQLRMRVLGLYDHNIDGHWGDGSFNGLSRALDLVQTLRPVVEPPDPNLRSLRWRPNWKLAMELATHEALIRQAYLDAPAPKGIWTWSVGLTSNTGHNVERYIRRPQPLQHCINVYIWALQKYALQVNAEFADYPLTFNEYAGAVSFHWNTGSIRRASWVRYMKAGNQARAEHNFKQWSNGGLLRVRRAKEADLIWRSLWSQDGRITEYPRLTRGHTPVWASAVRVDIKAEVLVAFGEQALVDMDQAPNPENVPSRPTLTS